MDIILSKINVSKILRIVLLVMAYLIIVINIKMYSIEDFECYKKLVHTNLFSSILPMTILLLTVILIFFKKSAYDADTKIRYSCYIACAFIIFSAIGIPFMKSFYLKQEYGDYVLLPYAYVSSIFHPVLLASVVCIPVIFISIFYPKFIYDTCLVFGIILTLAVLLNHMWHFYTLKKIRTQYHYVDNTIEIFTKDGQETNPNLQKLINNDCLKLSRYERYAKQKAMKRNKNYLLQALRRYEQMKLFMKPPVANDSTRRPLLQDQQLQKRRAVVRYTTKNMLPEHWKQVRQMLGEQ
jgi:hypothetical protein